MVSSHLLNQAAPALPLKPGTKALMQQACLTAIIGITSSVLISNINKFCPTVVIYTSCSCPNVPI